MRGEVPVPEPEPLGPDAVGRELLLEVEGLVGPPPPLLLVDAAAERVHHRVEVRTDLQPEEMDVVPGVPDDGDLGIRHGPTQPAQEPSPTNPTGQNHNPHGTQSVSTH